MPQPKLQVWQIQKWQKLKNNLVVAFSHALKSILKSDQKPRYMIPQSNENDKAGIFDRFFLITNFCVKIVTDTNKKILWGILIENWN